MPSGVVSGAVHGGKVIYDCSERRPDMTRIATWNCNMAFREKKDKILRYDPDILVIQECENPSVNGNWEEFTDWQWIGDNEHKGLGVFCRNGLTINSTGTADSKSRYFLPVEIEGGNDVLAVWAMNDKNDPKRRYIGQVYTGLQQYRDFVDSGTVVTGDFNWNLIWDDSPSSSLYGNFADTVEILSELGLVSSYHHITESNFGSELDPTFFMHKKEEQTYHTDYLFAPEDAIESNTNLYIGTYDDWIDASDHMPLVVEA